MSVVSEHVHMTLSHPAFLVVSRPFLFALSMHLLHPFLPTGQVHGGGSAAGKSARFAAQVALPPLTSDSHVLSSIQVS